MSWYEKQEFNGNEYIIIVFSIHGSETSSGVLFQNETVNTLDAYGSLANKIEKNVIILQHVCWGAYPDITRFMNRPSKGPLFTFGVVNEVLIRALNYAEREVLKFLATSHNIENIDNLMGLLDNINSYPSTTGIKSSMDIIEHTEFYRVWYFLNSEHSIQCYPKLTFKPVTRNQK